MFVSEKCVLFFEKSEVIFTKWCFVFVLFFDKSDYDHWVGVCGAGYSNMMAIKTFKMFIKCVFLAVLVTFLCDLKIDLMMSVLTNTDLHSKHMKYYRF